MAASKRGRGHPTKATDDIKRSIVKDVRRGIFLVRTAMAHGVTQQTVWNWANTDHEFFVALRKAEIELQRECLGTIEAGAEGWQGSAWLLERRFSREWSHRVKAAIMDREDELLRKLRDGLSHETFLEVLRVFAGDGTEGAGESDALGAVERSPALPPSRS